MGNTTLAQFFSRRLTGLRNRHGLSQQALADKCGVHLRSVQGWEKEGRVPHGKTLHNLATSLGVEVAYLTDEDYNPREEQITESGEIREGEDPRREAELWKRRANDAEQELADIKATLRLLAENRSRHRKEPTDKLSSSAPSDAAVLAERIGKGISDRAK